MGNDPPPRILQVALATPLRRIFDYLPPRPGGAHAMQPGVRVRVPFGRSTRIGLLLGVAAQSAVERGRLRRAMEVLDPEPVFGSAHLALLEWASRYYHHPIGEVVAACLPTLLRQGRPAHPAPEPCWSAVAGAADRAADVLRRAPRQRGLLEFLTRFPDGAGAEDLAGFAPDWRRPAAALVERGLAEVRTRDPRPASFASEDVPHVCAPALSEAQRRAVDSVRAALGGFQPLLLDGVTGSGKTEVYLQAIEAVLEAGRQALVLIPEIALSAQVLARFRERLRGPLAVLHSGLTDQERLRAWTAARDGEAAVVIGTRSAVWTPLARPGLIVVDEEHDASYKQQDGFRYSARDVAVVRAKREGVPVLLGTATPSLESLLNCRGGRYAHLHLPERAGAARPPEVQLLDVRQRPMRGGLCEPLIARMRSHLERGEQVLLFLNRRGYAPVLLCHECGWIATCDRCDARLVYHRQPERLHCHHCAAERALPAQCPDCGAQELIRVGQGTERLGESLGELFPDARIVRIDRDSTRRRGSLDALLAQVHAGEADILVGTQMLSKGHHFPKVTLVGVLDADGRLFGIDFRSGERLAQLVVQVAGRAGRADNPGTVVIQTHHPEHPLLVSLIARGYAAFAEQALAERRIAGLPPYTSLAVLRAEAPGRAAPMLYLEDARSEALALAAPAVELFGPVAAPMERRAGRYRAQLLLQSSSRGALQRLLDGWVERLEQLKSARRVRWSLDVDPQDLF